MNRSAEPRLWPISILPWKNAKPGTLVEDWVSNADMFATALGLLGLEKPATPRREIHPARLGRPVGGTVETL